MSVADEVARYGWVQSSSSKDSCVDEPFEWGTVTQFLRVLHATDKAIRLLELVRDNSQADCFSMSSEEFRRVPTAPFAYWVSDNVRALFATSPMSGRGLWFAKQGLATADDFRFVRCWYEVEAKALRSRWFPMAKGGRSSSFYRDLGAVVNWDRDGFELHNFVSPTTGKLLSRPQNVSNYFRAGISWPLRGIRFAAEAVPEGSVFSIAGKMAFGPFDELDSRLAIMNSQTFDRLMALFAGKVGGVQYESGLIMRTPVPEVNTYEAEKLTRLARSGWSARRSLDTAVEVSHAFILPALLQVEGCSLDVRVGAWAAQVDEIEGELARVQSEVDELCFELYGISEEDRRAITAGAGISSDADVEDDPTGADDG